MVEIVQEHVVECRRNHGDLFNDQGLLGVELGFQGRLSLLWQHLFIPIGLNSHASCIVTTHSLEPVRRNVLRLRPRRTDDDGG